MSGFFPLLVIGLGAAALFSPALSILIAVGIIPTIVLGVTGKGEYKSQRLQCLAYANIAGVVPSAAQVWQRPQYVESLITDPINLVVMWGAAVFGYGLIYIGPQIAAYILQALSQDRVKKIMQERQTLVETWGPDVLGEKEKAPAPNLIIPPKK
jgi:hypothetical protein